MLKVKPIRSMYMAGWLMYAKGLTLINKELDRRDTNHNVYLFEDTPELNKAMGEYIEMRKQQ